MAVPGFEFATSRSVYVAGHLSGFLQFYLFTHNVWVVFSIVLVHEFLESLIFAALVNLEIITGREIVSDSLIGDPLMGMTGALLGVLVVYTFEFTPMLNTMVRISDRRPMTPNDRRNITPSEIAYSIIQYPWYWWKWIFQLALYMLASSWLDVGIFNGEIRFPDPSENGELDTSPPFVIYIGVILALGLRLMMYFLFYLWNRGRDEVRLFWKNNIDFLKNSHILLALVDLMIYPYFIVGFTYPYFLGLLATITILFVCLFYLLVNGRRIWPDLRDKAVITISDTSSLPSKKVTLLKRS